MNTHTGYGVEAYAADKAWVLLDGIHRTRAVATKAKQDLIGQHGLEADDLRVVTLTITRKEDTPMTDQMIHADVIRAWRDKYQGCTGDTALEALDALLPAPPRPTLADMTTEERDDCTGMQADLAQGDRVVILDGTPDHDDRVQVLETSFDVFRPLAVDVTPRPDLPSLTWPGDQKPAPALPEGWRLADHPRHGRVVVTRPEPDRDGKVAITVSVPTYDDRARLEWCTPAELTYLEQGGDQ